MKKKSFRLFLTLVIFLFIFMGCTRSDTPDQRDAIIVYINAAVAANHEIEDELADEGAPVDMKVSMPLPASWAYLSAGRTHTVAIGTDGSLWAWGGNRSGQLGDGTTTDRLSPVRIGADYDWTSVSAGRHRWDSHTAALRTDGSLWVWGGNVHGQLGNGMGENWDDSRANSAVPIQIAPDYKWVSVSAGHTHTLAIRNDGTLWIWGMTGSAANGLRSLNPIFHGDAPVQLGEETNWMSVSAGDIYNAAIKTDGSLWGWRGDIEHWWYESITIRNDTPIQIETATDWVSVSAGMANALAIRADGSLWGWGRNDAGQLGDGTRTYRDVPVQIETSSNRTPSSWASVVSGHFHTVALKADGSLWTWGVNVYGQLGDGTGGHGWGDRSDDRHSPVRIGMDYDWVCIAASSGRTLAAKADGSLWAWGNNQWGQLGDGTTITRLRPVRITP